MAIMECWSFLGLCPEWRRAGALEDLTSAMDPEMGLRFALAKFYRAIWGWWCPGHFSAVLSTADSVPDGGLLEFWRPIAG